MKFIPLILLTTLFLGFNFSVNGQGSYVQNTCYGTFPDSLTFEAYSTDNSCFGYCDGEIVITPLAGSGNYSYEIYFMGNLVSTSSIGVGLCAGQYDIIVTDNGTGISCTDVLDVFEPLQMTANYYYNPPSCGGCTDGYITADITGGSGAYFYVWYDFQGQPAGTGDTLFNVQSSNYYLSAIDGNGCVETFPLVIVQPCNYNFTAGSTDASCQQQCDGKAWVDINGSSGPYSIEWNDQGNSTTDTAFNLCPGNYCATITDANGCISDTCVTVDAPTPPSYTLLTEDCSAYGVCDGTAELDITGGLPPYTITWYDSNFDPIAGEDSTFIDSLCAGDYYYSVEDGYSCYVPCDSACYSFMDTINGGDSIVLHGFTINQPQQLGLDLLWSMDTYCYGECTGSAQVQAIGGVPPFEYTLMGQTNNTGEFYSLCPGTYPAVVTDSTGATATVNVDIYEPMPLSLSGFATDEQCYQACNGEIQLTATGGTLWSNDYSYSIDGQNYQNNSLFTNVCPGAYVCSVIDDNGCSVVYTVIVNPATQLTLSVSSTNETMPGAQDGVIAITNTAGGPSPYLWSIDGGNTWNNQTTWNNLSAGTYSVCAQDANGCVTCETVTIGSTPCSFDITAAYSDLLCAGDCNGTIDITTNANNPTFIWNDGQTTEDASNLCVGNYCVTVTDGSGCVKDTCFEIIEPQPLEVIAYETMVTCNGNCDGEIEMIATGGTQPYMYSVDGGSNLSQNSVASNLCPGVYDIQVIDANACSLSFGSTSITITEPTVLTASYSTTPESSVGAYDGMIIVTASGGTSGYGFTIDGGTIWTSGSNVYTFPYLTQGMYEICTIDSMGCQTCDSVYVDVTMGINSLLEGDVEVYPNPNDGVFKISLPNEIENASVEIVDAVGRIIYSEKISIDSFIDIRHLTSKGMYTLRIKSEESILSSRIIIQ